MGVHSGKFGVVNGQTTVRDWSIVDTMSPNTYYASNTKFMPGRVIGAESWSGSFNWYGHTPTTMPGEFFSFSGYTAPDDDVDGAGLLYTGTAIVESISIAWDWTSGQIIQGSTNFQGHLALTTNASGAQPSDLTLPTVPSSVGTHFEVGDLGGSVEEWDGLTNATLTITNQVKSYVNSSSAVGGRLWTGQKAGNYDLTLSATEQDVTRALFDKGDMLIAHLYVTDSLYWDLEWLFVQDFGGISVNRESGDIIEQTINFGFSGWDTTAGSYAAGTGHIILPDSTEWWPALTTTAAPTTT